MATISSLVNSGNVINVLQKPYMLTQDTLSVVIFTYDSQSFTDLCNLIGILKSHWCLSAQKKQLYLDILVLQS